MNYNELKIIAERKNFTIKQLSETIGMSSTGLKRSIEGETISMKTIRDLCQLLGITVSEFFGESAVTVPMSGASVGEVAWLRNQLSVKDGEIDRLLRLMEAQAGLQPKKAAV